MEFAHIPVLQSSVIDGLCIDPKGTYLDGTCGGGGHASQIAKCLNGGRLLCIDRDPDAVSAASKRLEGLNAAVIRGNYSDMADIAGEQGIKSFNGILLDLGVSSYQLDCPERGFSYHADAALDMRMSKEGISAADIVNNSSEEELRRILYDYGEERFAPGIARAIIEARETKPVETTSELADIVRENIPARFRREKNPCKKTFQAIRIAVNREFEHLEKALEDGFDMLSPGGRFCVITFHSLEDRIVKRSFAEKCRGCTCPPDFPVCVCGKTPAAKQISKKPIEASPEEQAENPRSRSAKLRIIEKL